MAVTSPFATRAAGVLEDAPAGTFEAGRESRPVVALVLALLAALAYAVFADGAAGLPEESHVQVWLALVALVAAGAWLATGSLRLALPPAGWAAVILLGLFAAWVGTTLLWSVTPDRTWQHLNRVLAYVLVVLLAAGAGASAGRTLERIAGGWLMIAAACALYAVGGKVAPGLALGPLDLDHTSELSRLRAPLEYWNALALVCVLGVPVAVRFAVDRTLTPVARLAALGGLWLLLCCLGMTYSRGGVVALVVAVVVMTVLTGARLRCLAVLALAATLALPVLLVAFAVPELADNNVALGERIDAGGRLGLAMIVCLAVLLALGWAAARLETRVTWSEGRSRATWSFLGGLALVAVLVALGSALTAPGGVGGVLDRATDSFTSVRQDRVSDPARLVSASSANRWVWWKEAAGAWWDEPVAGWGAGSFPVTHKLYRRDELAVAQPHSVPLQFLAETGLVGAALALGGLGLVLWVAVAWVRALPGGREREISVALLAAVLAWAVQQLYDWGWDIPGVTLPALVFAGLLAGRAGAALAEERRRELPAVPAGDDAGARLALLGVAAVVLCGIAASSILPAWADGKASAALAVSPRAGEEELSRAAADAETAIRLDPTSVRGHLAAASIAEGRGRRLEAKRLLLHAADRQPYNQVVWVRLARLAILLEDRRGLAAAARRSLVLDPAGGPARGLAERAAAFQARPNGSPTATGTPLGAAAAGTTTAPPAAGGTATPPPARGDDAAPKTPAPSPRPETTPRAPARPGAGGFEGLGGEGPARGSG